MPGDRGRQSLVYAREWGTAAATAAGHWRARLQRSGVFARGRIRLSSDDLEVRCNCERGDRDLTVHERAQLGADKRVAPSRCERVPVDVVGHDTLDEALEFTARRDELGREIRLVAADAKQD